MPPRVCSSVLPELLGGESATIVVAATVTGAAPDDIVNTATANRHILYGVISPQDTTGYVARLNRGADFRWSDYQDGIAVTAGNKTLYIANPSGGSVVFDIAVAGVGTYSDT